MSNNAPDYEDNLYFENNEIHTNLTELWKKDKLPSRWWYIEVNAMKPFYSQSVIEIAKYITSFDYPAKEIKNVLAPVPSYEELQNMDKVVHQAMAANIKLVEENKRLKHDVGNLGYRIKNQRKEIEKLIKQNAKLKRLLTECASDFETYAKEDETCGLEEENKLAKNILPKIREALK
jgi:hypothetical protein